MSSLAATKADGYYHPPPDLTRPRTGPKRDTRAAKRRRPGADGIVVRFPLPRNGKCGKCRAWVGAGTRFNATKTRVQGGQEGAWRFAFDCAQCDAELVVVTQPDSASFAFEGALEETKAHVNKEYERIAASEDSKTAVEMRRLEARVTETNKLQEAEKITSVREHAAVRDRELNRLLRDRMRERKRPLKEGLKRGLALELMPIKDVEDEEEAIPLRVKMRTAASAKSSSSSSATT